MQGMTGKGCIMIFDMAYLIQPLESQARSKILGSTDFDIWRSLCCSETLCSAVINVAGQPIGSIFKSQARQEEFILTTN